MCLELIFQVRCYFILVYYYRGYVGPGGNHEWGAHRSCSGGVIGYLDRLILGENHLFERSPASVTYDAQDVDPEGLLRSMQLWILAFLGVQCGVTLLVYPDWRSRTKRWLCWSILCAISAGILSGLQLEDGPVPINKSLGSLSFVLASTAIAFALFTLTYWLVDVKQCWSGNPFRWVGMNSILIFFYHWTMKRVCPHLLRFGPINTHFVLLLDSGFQVAMWMIVAWYLHRKQIFLKV